ncbi:hypothetical protein AJ87_40165 [Rhizobium yanglingense]|nr:hypothetical protein AJ87_40165 [Rhizobium yanglingense]
MRRPLEGGGDNVRLVDGVAGEFGRDAALAEDVDAVAEADLVHLRRVPDEGAAVRRFLADDRVDLLLGPDVDAAHRIVHQDNRSARRKRAREEYLLLVAAGKRQDAVVHIGRADLDPPLPVGAFRPLFACEDEAAPGQVAERCDGEVAQDAPQLEDAVEAAVAGDEGDERITLGSQLPDWEACRASRSSVCPWPARPASPMISPLRAMKERPAA